MKLFIEIGTTLINIKAIAFIAKTQNGNLRITSTVPGIAGAPQTFLIRDREDADELKRQLSPYIVTRLEGGEIDAEPNDLD